MPKVTASGPSVASERVAEDAEETAEAPDSAEAQAVPGAAGVGAPAAGLTAPAGPDRAGRACGTAGARRR